MSLSRLVFLPLVSALVLFVSSTGAAQCPPPVLDPTNQLGSGVDSWVHSLGVFNGDLVACGYFTTAGGVTVNGIARWTGFSWAPFGSGMDGPVFAVASYGGHLVAGGAFSTAGGVAASNIAAWNGSSWQPLGAGTDLAVIELFVFGGELIAGGDFAVVDGIAASHVAAWNGSNWHVLGLGLDSTVHALVSHGGQLVAGGSFLSYVAAWDGSTWTPLGPGIQGPIYALAEYAGELITGGTYIVPPPQQQQLSSVKRFSGGIWQTLGAGINGYDVESLCVYGGRLIVGGQFTGSAGTPLQNLAAWDGSSFQPLGNGLDSAVDALFVHGGALIAGGLFVASGAVPAAYISRWSSPLPLLGVSQSVGPGAPTLVMNSGLVPGREYINVVSFDLCGGAPGSGPYGGLCFTAVSALYAQLAAPVGAIPFHFLATAPTVFFGPYQVLIGLTFDAVCADVTGGAVGCISPAIRVTIH